MNCVSWWWKVQQNCHLWSCMCVCVCVCVRAHAGTCVYNIYIYVHICVCVYLCIKELVDLSKEIFLRQNVESANWFLLDVYEKVWVELDQLKNLFEFLA